MTNSRDPSARSRELRAIRDTYERYRREGRKRLWDPANRGFARMMRDRDVSLVQLLARSLPESGGKVLDVGSGDGRLAASGRDGRLSVASWTGVDLDATNVAEAAGAYPWATFVEASADALPFADRSFHVAVASTLFSSLPSERFAQVVADEIGRVVVPGGWLVWYDLRYDNPRNPDVHGIGADALGRLFPEWTRELRSVTLLPPLARRLGPLTPVLYPLLEAIPPLRSHLVGRLRRPTTA